MTAEIFGGVMKFALGSIFLFLSLNVYALDCIDMAAQDVLKGAAKTLGVSKSTLQVRYIGGESFDGDLDHGNIYKDHSGEYFDIFLSDENPVTAKAIQMYAVGIYIYSNTETGKIVKCENYSIEDVDSNEWAHIYDLYL
jgi:hypothetical protein